MKRFFIMFLGVSMFSGMFFGPAWALNFSFTGTFSQDDEVQLFDFSVGTFSTVTLKTLSYAGGTQADGNMVSAGGFDPILALFDSTGGLIDENDDGSPPDVGTDPGTGQAYDTFLQLGLNPGDYTVAISQYDNFAIGPNLSNGFDRVGSGNFTGAGFSCSNGAFCDVEGENRTNGWAFDILNVEGASLPGGSPDPVPEPSALFLLGTGLAGLVVLRGRKKIH